MRIYMRAHMSVCVYIYKRCVVVMVNCAKVIAHKSEKKEKREKGERMRRRTRALATIINGCCSARPF